MTAPEQAQDLLSKIEGTDASMLQAHMNWKDVAKALETIAGLHYEYAVQVKMSSGGWRYTDEEQYPFGGESPCSVMWSPQDYAEEMLESFVELDGREYVRIVRRLAGDVEVPE